MARVSTQALANDLSKALERYEGKVSNAEMIGALEMVKLSIFYGEMVEIEEDEVLGLIEEEEEEGEDDA